jgi:integrase/recombinase XerD
MPRPPAAVRSGRTKTRKRTAENGNTNKVEELVPDAQVETRLALASLVTDEPEVPVETPKPTRRRNANQGDESAPVRAIQPPLFTVSSRGELLQSTAEIPPLVPDSPLSVARWWFRSYLEQIGRPRNTVASYMYDLAGFEEFTGSERTLEDLNRDDINGFLAQSQKKSTRKRRLTSLGAFYKYLINVEKILEKDPTDNFYAEFIPLKTPTVLTQVEQEALLQAALRENSRTYMMAYFMLRLGFTRTELLAILVEHVDVSDPANPIIYVFYEDKRWHKKERKLAAAPEFVSAFKRYIAEFAPPRKLFEMLPQSVNKLVERVAKDAGINKKVTPQSLRDTFAVEEARLGANSTKLMLILGLAPDPRNRMSVERYIKLSVAV